MTCRSRTGSGDDRLQADGPAIASRAVNGGRERRGEVRRVPGSAAAGLRRPLGHGLQPGDLPGRGAADGGQLRGGLHLVAQVPGVHQPGVDRGGRQEPVVHLGGAELRPAPQVGGSRRGRLQVEQWRAPAADREAERGVPHGGAGRGRGGRLGEQPLDARLVQLPGRGAVTVVIYEYEGVIHEGQGLVGHDHLRAGLSGAITGH
jgi:hypothetical protein